MGNKLTFGQYLRSIRESRNLTAKELKYKFNISQTYTTRVELNCRLPSLYLLCQYVQAYKMTDEEIVMLIRKVKVE